MFPIGITLLGSSSSIFTNVFAACLQMSLEMHFLPENQRDQEHKERAYGKVLAPGDMQIGLCSAFFMIYDSSHGTKLEFRGRFCIKISEQRLV